jgi:hypothetical protein
MRCDDERHCRSDAPAPTRLPAAVTLNSVALLTAACSGSGLSSAIARSAAPGGGGHQGPHRHPVPVRSHPAQRSDARAAVSAAELVAITSLDVAAQFADEFLYLISGRVQVKLEPRTETEKLRRAQASLP